MNLLKAYEEMKKGKVVRRLNAPNSLAYHEHENISWFTWKYKDNDFAYGSSRLDTDFGSQNISIKDALANDWEVVE